MGGLALYFDKALGQMLLYAAERQQYQDLMRQQVWLYRVCVQLPVEMGPLVARLHGLLTNAFLDATANLRLLQIHLSGEVCFQKFCVLPTGTVSGGAGGEALQSIWRRASAAAAHQVAGAAAPDQIPL